MGFILRIFNGDSIDGPKRKKSVSWPWKWNQSLSQTHNFPNGQTRYWMLHWEQVQKISIVTRRSGTSHIDQSFWENLTRAMGSGMGEMLQAKQSQQQPTVTPSAQAGRRELYNNWSLADMMGYVQVYIGTGIPRIWGNFKCPRNFLTTTNNYCQE